MSRRDTAAWPILSTWLAVFDKEARKMTLIATIIVWAIIQAVCAKNPGPMMILVFLYVILSAVAEIIY